MEPVETVIGRYPGKTNEYFKASLKAKTDYVYDPERQYAVIKCSICTGEKVAGFKNKTDGHFTEVMLIASPEDEATFMYAFGLDDVTVTSNKRNIM